MIKNKLISTLLIFSLLVVTLASTTSATDWCYLETQNLTGCYRSTVGSYFNITAASEWLATTPPQNAVDGNYSNTGGSNDTRNSTSYIYINVTIPRRTTGMIMDFVTGSGTHLNLSIPAKQGISITQYLIDVNGSNLTGSITNLSMNRSGETLARIRLYSIANKTECNLISSTANTRCAGWQFYNNTLSWEYGIFASGSSANSNEITDEAYWYLTEPDEQINITFRDQNNNIILNSISVNICDVYNSSCNTYSVSTGNLLFTGINNTNYNISVSGANYTSSSISYQLAYNASINYSLLFTDTLNITFHNQATPSSVLSGPLIGLDVISDSYSNNYSTTSGLINIAALPFDTYTLRYYSAGYQTRFYNIIIANQSYQALDLYMINTSLVSNLTVYVVDQVTNPVEGALVKALKYNLATNTYILQEIGSTDVAGRAAFSVTTNEFWKFIVEYQGDTKKITDPAYVTAADLLNGLTIQIDFSQRYGGELYTLEDIDSVLDFNNNTDSFRFDWNDPSGVSTQFCVYVYKGENQSQTLFNSSCSSGGSGTILLGVSNEPGVTYTAYAYFYQDGIAKYLRGKSYTYPSTNVFGSYGLYLQVLLTLGFTGLLFVSGAVGVVMVPFSLILGNYIGLNAFSYVGLIALQIAGVIVAIIILARKQ